MLDPVERKMLYAFLSVLFRHPDDQTVAAASGVRDETFQSIFPGLAAPSVPTLGELQDGYRYLFLSPPVVAPPYGSAYLDKPDSAGYSARLVANLYASAGLGMENSPESPDYLPSELEFLYYLTEGEEQSLARESGTPPHRWVASQADFFHNFFSPWITPFCARIEADAQALPFYQWSARLLRHFVEMERQRLKAG
jgi:TorA maturation chaperone TorD